MCGRSDPGWRARALLEDSPVTLAHERSPAPDLALTLVSLASPQRSTHPGLGGARLVRTAIAGTRSAKRWSPGRSPKASGRSRPCTSWICPAWTLPLNGQTSCRPTAASRSANCCSSDLRGPGQGHCLRLPSDSRHRGWTFARPPAQTSLRRCAVGSRLAKARIAADRPGREVATWLLYRAKWSFCTPCWMRRTGQARRLQLVDANEVEIAECGP
jgi:hypothetical protein